MDVLGLFCGYRKGSRSVLEKDWGSIKVESYCVKVVPLIEGWIRLNPSLIFMQDNALLYSALITLQELRDRGIQFIEWPVFSPDLNPIEAVWNLMKQWI